MKAEKSIRLDPSFDSRDRRAVSFLPAVLVFSMLNEEPRISGRASLLVPGTRAIATALRLRRRQISISNRDLRTKHQRDVDPAGIYGR